MRPVRAEPGAAAGCGQRRAGPRATATRPGRGGGSARLDPVPESLRRATVPQPTDSLWEQGVPGVLGPQRVQGLLARCGPTEPLCRLHGAEQGAARPGHARTALPGWHSDPVNPL